MVFPVNSSWTTTQMIFFPRAGPKKILVAAADDWQYDSFVAGWECQNTLFCSDGNITCMSRSMSNVPSSIFRASCGAILSHTQVCKSPRQRCKRTRPSNTFGSFVAVRRVETLFGYMRLTHSCGIISDRIKFMQDSVSSSRTDVFTSLVKNPYNVRTLYVGLDLRATTAGVGTNARGSRSSAIISLGVAVGHRSCGILSNTHGCERWGLSAAGLRKVSLAILRAIGNAGGASCRSSVEATTSRALAWEQSLSSLSWQSPGFALLGRRVSLVRRRRSRVSATAKLFRSIIWLHMRFLDWWLAVGFWTLFEQLVAKCAMCRFT